MTEQTTPLRQRMIEDMTIRNMSPSTQKIYVRAVANFSIYHGRSPDKLTSEDVRDYRLHLISRGLKATSQLMVPVPITTFGSFLGREYASRNHIRRDV
jgi:site-specific recombinase XerD